MDSREVASNAPDKADMFCRVREFNVHRVNDDRGGVLNVVNYVCHVSRVVNLQFCLFGAQFNIVLGAEDFSEMKKIQKIMDVV